MGIAAAVYAYVSSARPPRELAVSAHGTSQSTTTTTSLPAYSTPTVIDSRKVVSIGGQAVRVDIADTPALREKGLSGRVALAAGEGMLFVFPEEGLHSFWMKDMHFPIDIIWLDVSGKVVHIAPNVPPESYPTTFLPENPARFVLEVPAGFAAAHSIGVGSRAVLPE